MIYRKNEIRRLSCGSIDTGYYMTIGSAHRSTAIRETYPVFWTLCFSAVLVVLPAGLAVIAAVN